MLDIQEISRAVRRWQYEWACRRTEREFLKGLKVQEKQLNWRIGPRCPQRIVEANRAIIGPRLYTSGGYVDDLYTINRHLFAFNMVEKQWRDCGEIPDDMAETHNLMLSDGERFLFSISGQRGPHCSPAVDACFAYDTQMERWSRLPNLPRPRYMPIGGFFRGRLYISGGTREDRCTPATECWSIEIRDGKAVGDSWREEPHLSLNRTHTPSLMIDNEWIICGGQVNDVPPIAGHPEQFCDFEANQDELFNDCFAVDMISGRRRELSAMPLAISHTECAICQVGRSIIIGGGTLSRLQLSDNLLVYNLDSDKWSILGRLPRAIKKTILAYHRGSLFVIAGQNSASDDDLKPGKVVDTVWECHFELR